MSHSLRSCKKRSLRSPLSFKRSSILATILLSSLGLGVLPALTAEVPAGTEITNKATGSFEDELAIGEVLIESNTVKVTVVEVAGVTVTATGMTGTPAPGNTVFFTFRITNAGNDPTRFLIPGTPSNITNGIAGNITVIEYDPDGIGTTAPTPISTNNTVLPAGSDTGTLAGIPNNGSIPANGSLLVQVPVTIPNNATGTSVSVTLGNTTPVNSQNIVYTNGGNDLYTIDNNNTDNGDVAGDPINGDSTNHRQEASDTNTVPLILLDRSDAPISGVAPSGTGTNSYGEATHTIVNGIRLGAAIDNDSVAIDSATASGDGADDDGISNFPILNTGATSYSIPVTIITATGTGTLHAWIDFNKNGTFEAGEHRSVAVTNNTPAGALNWNGITVGAVGKTFARFRFTSDTNVTSATPSGNASDGEVEDYQVMIVSNPSILLVKRITAIDGGTGTIGGDNLASYKDTANPYDDNTLDPTLPNATYLQKDTNRWPAPSSFLLGGTNGGNVRKNDEMDYTIYFLSAGDGIANNVTICDLIPEKQSFVSRAYNSITPAPGGFTLVDRGITVFTSGTTTSFTNVADGDAGSYYAPGETLPNACKPSPTAPLPTNTNGAIVVNLGNLPPATAPGLPINSHGYIRFRVRID
jgi:hypothetical protein